MTNKELRQALELSKTETRTALQILYDTLNHGQQQKILKEEKVKELFDRYGVEYSQ